MPAAAARNRRIQSSNRVGLSHLLVLHDGWVTGVRHAGCDAWAVGAIGFRAKFVARCAESGAPAQTGRATMSKAKLFAFVASVAAVSFGSTASLAQQPPPQSPNMTFFITSSGPGKGADLGRLEGADRQC